MTLKGRPRIRNTQYAIRKHPQGPSADTQYAIRNTQYVSSLKQHGLEIRNTQYAIRSHPQRPSTDTQYAVRNTHSPSKDCPRIPFMPINTQYAIRSVRIGSKSCCVFLEFQYANCPQIRGTQNTPRKPYMQRVSCASDAEGRPSRCRRRTLVSPLRHCPTSRAITSSGFCI